MKKSKNNEGKAAKEADEIRKFKRKTRRDKRYKKKRKLTCTYLCIGIRLLSPHVHMQKDTSILCLLFFILVDKRMWSNDERYVDRKYDNTCAQ